MEWQWVGELRKRSAVNLMQQDWAFLATDLALVAQHLNHVEIRPNNRIGEPWIGAWDAFKKQYPK
jgi:hypothetical protein